MKPFKILPLLFFVIVFSSFVSAGIGDDIVSCYDFEGNASDYMGVNDGTLVSSPATATGIVGDAYTYDGSNDYVDLGSVSDFCTTSCTLSFWVKESASTLCGVNGFTNDWYIYHTAVGSNGQRFFATSTINQVTLDNPQNTHDGTFHHYLMTIEDGNSTLYVDGNYKSSGAGPSMGTLSDTKVYFGRILNSNTGYWCNNNVIDQVVLYDAVKTSSDVTDLYNSGSGLSCADTVTPTATASEFKIYANDTYTGNMLTNFTTYLYSGGNFTTTNGTINTGLFTNSTELYNITFYSDEAGGYFQRTFYNVNISSDYTGELFQTVINLAAFEYLTGTQIYGTFQNETGSTVSPPLYYTAGNWTFTFVNTSYYSKTQEFEVPNLFNGTLNITDVATSIINVTVSNAYSGSPINDFSGWAYNNDVAYNTSFSTTDGYYEVPAAFGNYTIYVEVDGYAIDEDTNFLNLTVDQNLENASFELWSNNSIRISIYDETTTALITGTNISITLTGNVTETTYYTTTGTYFLQNVTDGAYTVKFTGGNYTLKSYDITVADRSTQILNAYLSSEYQTVIFTISNYNTGLPIEGASFQVARLINSSYTTTDSKTSDLTGKVQTSYLPNIKYRFTVSADGFNDKIFYLDPVIFSSYTVYLVPTANAGEEEAFDSVSVVYTPKIFYDEEQNNLTIIFSSPTGTLSLYGFNITYPGGWVADSNTNANGAEFDVEFNITGSNLLDTVNITYYYDTTLADLRTFSTTHAIIGASVGNYTWARFREAVSGSDSLGDYEKVLIVLLFVIVTAGGAYFLVGAKGSLLIGSLVWGIGAYLLFLNVWVILPSLLVGFAAIVGGND